MLNTAPVLQLVRLTMPQIMPLGLLCGIVAACQAQVELPVIILPNPAPAASSVTVTVQGPRLLGTASDSSAISGKAILSLDSLLMPEMAQLTELSLTLDEPLSLSLFGLSASSLAGDVQVVMLEPGLASSISADGSFDQLGNLFQFAGALDVSIQDDPLELEELTPIAADLLGIQLLETGDGWIAELDFDIETETTIETFLGDVPVTIRAAGSVLGDTTEQNELGDGGDFDRSGVLDETDVNLLLSAIRNGNQSYDLNADQAIDQLDLAVWVHDLKSTWFGDADLDGLFDSRDLVQIFQEGQYADAFEGNSRWSTGDWDGDAEFSSADIVVAFQDGGYDAGTRASTIAVPEPRGGLWPAFLIATTCCHLLRQRHCFGASLR